MTNGFRAFVIVNPRSAGGSTARRWPAIEAALHETLGDFSHAFTEAQGGGSRLAADALRQDYEMIVAIGKGGANIPVGKALDHVFGYGVGLDMTRRDIQGEAKKMGRPWEMGKAFDHSAPCTALRTVERVGHPGKGAIWLKINGEVRQKGDLSEMIWNVPETIAYLSKLVTLRAGDVIMSGTPAGVGPVQRGDKLEGHVDGVGDLSVTYK